MALPHWFRECIQVTEVSQESEHGENVLNFPARRDRRASNDGQSALDLVYQAAEIVGDLQDHARQTETRAQTLCRSAVEKLRLSQRRAESAESALYHAESLISSAEAKLSAAELRAKNAEAKARELDRALSLIEEAIRTRLLGQTRSPNVMDEERQHNRMRTASSIR